MSEALEYVFRGTTISFKGSSFAQNEQMTSTTSNPIIALWFAKECLNKNPDKACVYLAKSDNLSGIQSEKNVLASIESEIGYKIAPTEFYKRTEGYFLVQDFQSVLTIEGFDCQDIVRIENLSRLCFETKNINPTQIKKIVQSLLPYLKKA